MGGGGGGGSACIFFLGQPDSMKGRNHGILVIVISILFIFKSPETCELFMNLVELGSIYNGYGRPDRFSK